MERNFPNYEMTAQPGQNYQTLTKGRSVTTSYMNSEKMDIPNYNEESMATPDAVIYQNAPPLPPRPPDDYDYPVPSQADNVQIHSVSNQKHPKCGNKKVFMITGVLFAMAVLIAILALLFGVVNSKHVEQQSFPQNSTLIDDLVSRLDFLENFLQLGQQNDMTGLNTTDSSLLSNLSSLQSRITALENNLNIAILSLRQMFENTQHQIQLSNMSSQLKTSILEGNLKLVNSSLRQRLTSIQSALTTTNNRLLSSDDRLTSIYSDFINFRSNLTRVNLFSRCVKEDSTCPVTQRSVSLSHWYLCHTRNLLINSPVSSQSRVEIKLYVLFTKPVQKFIN